jgi:hypothetical protein
MKSGVVLLLSLILFIGLVSVSPIKAESPSAPVSDSDMQKIQGVTDQIPIDNSGGLDQGKIAGWKSQAELRIEAINKYVGPITKLLFGVELTLSWIFIFAFILWVELAEFIGFPLQALFNMKYGLSVIAGLAASSIIMHSFGEKLSNLLNSIFNVWWSVLSAIVVSIIFFFIIWPFIMKGFKKKREEAEKRKEERDREILHRNAEREANAERELSEGDKGLPKGYDPGDRDFD